MKVLFYVSSLLIVLGITTACTSQQGLGNNLSTLASTNGTSNCNTFTVSNVVVANVKLADSNDLAIEINQLNSSFMTSSGTLTFYALAVTSAGVSGRLQLPVNGAGSLTPAMLASMSLPAVVTVSGVSNTAYNVMEVDATIGGSAASPVDFLIPQFEADPNVYVNDSRHFQAVDALHPFINYLGQQGLNFAQMAQQFCF